MHVTPSGALALTEREREVLYDTVGPRYFRAIGARVIRGREFDERDTETSTPVAIINETAARDFFPRFDPVGQTLADDGAVSTIVGVVNDMQEQDVRGAPQRRVYLPILQGTPPTSVVLMVRTMGAPTRSIGPLRAAILEADRNLEFTIDPLDTLIRGSVVDEILATGVTGVFGVLALGLAALGLYGVMSYATRRRTGEFGLRFALGAQPSSVTRMIVREAAVLAALGLAVGLPAAYAATRLIRQQLFGVPPLDPWSFGAAVALLAVTTLAASYVPARRAARIAPIEALREE